MSGSPHQLVSLLHLAAIQRHLCTHPIPRLAKVRPRSSVSSAVVRPLTLIWFCLLATFVFGRQVEVVVKDTTGALVPQALARPHCSDHDLGEVSLAREINLPDGEICELVVHAE